MQILPTAPLVLSEYTFIAHHLVSFSSEKDLSACCFTSKTDECGTEVMDRGLRRVPVRPAVSRHHGGRLSAQTREPRRGRCT